MMIMCTMLDSIQLGKLNQWPKIQAVASPASPAVSWLMPHLWCTALIMPCISTAAAAPSWKLQHNSDQGMLHTDSAVPKLFPNYTALFICMHTAT
jgi:hypothetical protein